jgi:hypothetical protein
MCRTIFVAFVCGIGAAVIAFLCLTPEPIVFEADVGGLQQQIIDESRRDRSLTEAFARNGYCSERRQAMIEALIDERASLADVRRVFREANDEVSGSWKSLRATFPNCSDELIVDLQIRSHLRARGPTPSQITAYERYMAELPELPRRDGEAP